MSFSAPAQAKQDEHALREHVLEAAEKQLADAETRAARLVRLD